MRYTNRRILYFYTILLFYTILPPLPGLAHRTDSKKSQLNRWEYRKDECCVNICDDFSVSDEIFMNFAQVTPEILLLICMGGWVHIHGQYARVFYLSSRMSGLIFAKLSANIEG